jgi:ELWxxDGT repeat protein
MFGLAGDDALSGAAGNDTILAGDGADTLEGGKGADSLDGGIGLDTASYAKSGAAVAVDLGAGTGTGGDAQGDVLANIENLTGSKFGDTLTGDAGANVLDGGAGADLLSGGGGDDVLIGGSGADLLSGGDGDDTLLGGNAADTLSGGAGDDVLIGGSGADHLDGGAGINTASYEGSTKGVVVDLGAGTASKGDAQGDSLVNIQNLTGSAQADTLTGDNGANVLDGGAGNDRLSGSGGDDTLIGGLGDDTLAGGAGNDAFVYSAAAESPGGDLITDFTQGADKIDLSALLGATDLAFVGLTAAANGIWYANAGGNTDVFADVTGDGVADLHVKLTGTHALTASDFIGVAAPATNHAPVITSGGGGPAAVVSVAENATAVMTVTASDSDLPPQTLVYSISGGADAARFAIDSVTGALSFVAAPDFENPQDAGHDNVYDVTVTVTDNGAPNLSDSQAIAVTVADVNEAPTSVTLANATLAIAENTDTSAGIKVADIVVADDALGTDNLSLTGADAARFVIVGTGLYLKDGLLDFESKSSYSVQVRVDDPAVGGTPDATSALFTVSVTDVNEAPTGIALSAASIEESASAGAVVGQLTGADPDAGDVLTFTLLDDAGGKFAIDSANRLVVAGALDFETGPSESVTVRVTDSHGLTRDEIFTIAVQDTADPLAPLYFAATDATHGEELWQANGAQASLAADVAAGAGDSNPEFPALFDGALYFGAGDAAHGQELWRFDGASATLAADIDPGAGDSAPQDLTVFNGALYFSADDGTHGNELWKFDGAAATPVADINAGPGSSNPQYLTVFNGALYFSANDGVHGQELWKYDGTTASLVADVFPGSSGSGPAYLTVLNGALYFSAFDTTHGFELWKYDGTSASLVSDIFPGVGGSGPQFLTVFNGALYFSAGDGVNGQELWKYDGTTASMVADINAGVAGSFSQDLTVFKGALYFGAFDADHGFELWKYNGSSASLVADIDPGGDGSNPSSLTVADGALYFSATDGTHGTELWKYDGTTLSLVSDINPGGAGSTPGSLVATGETLFGSGGADSLTGHAGNDFLLGGSGNDTLTGGAGSDAFIFKAGETGTDTIADFHAGAGGDVLDLHAVLSGPYDPSHPASDYVHLTANGGNTTVSVDADGAANGANFVAVATLTGVTATDLNQLLADGNITLAAGH